MHGSHQSRAYDLLIRKLPLVLVVAFNVSMQSSH